jgi:hypothetical protein
VAETLPIALTIVPPICESPSDSFLLEGRDVASATKRHKSTPPLEDGILLQPKRIYLCIDESHSYNKENLQNHVVNSHPLQSESNYQKHIYCLLHQL